MLKFLRSPPLRPAEEAIARVLRGMALLDHYRPGWENDIKLELLDQCKNPYYGHCQCQPLDYCQCVLCQLYGSSARGVEKLGLVGSLWREMYHDFLAWRGVAGSVEAYYGFAGNWWVEPELVEVWKRLVRQRRQQAARG